MMSSKSSQATLDLASGSDGPVECFGFRFASASERRTHFRNELRKHLEDPSFRAREGFPVGTNEDILEMSDPPYYTACPNPFLADVISFHGRPYAGEPVPVHEPFAADVAEGKNEPIYNAHSYHTKVPYRAIVRYLMHYTSPGDVVLDGFCGTGMTGVAAQMCGDAEVLSSMGYSGAEVETKGGRRTAILGDLSPAATFIARNYNTRADVQDFSARIAALAADAERDLGWMYQTKHANGDLGRVNYTVWSDVFSCPECGHEASFWSVAVDEQAKVLRDDFPCSDCGAHLSKRKLERVWVSVNDSHAGISRMLKQVPVLINYSVGSRRFEKKPDTSDFDLIRRIDDFAILTPLPYERMIVGQESRRNDDIGMTHVHHYFTKRNLAFVSYLFDAAARTPQSHLIRQTILDCFPVITKLSRFRVPAWFDKSTGPMKGWTAGTLYAPSLQGEQNVLNSLTEKARMVARALRPSLSHQWITTGDSSKTGLPDESVDYIFLDPPFGANINYSELNFLAEAWIRIATNNGREAITNPSQGKSLTDYRELMVACFEEAYRVLKPGRWMTVEFSNTQASVWNSIQIALQEAGFVVANVSALDKKQGSFKAVTTTTAVKQDLVISAYKPNGGIEERFVQYGGSVDSAWDFVSTHLKYVPIIKLRNGALEFISERDPRIIFDRMVSWFIKHNTPVPLSSSEFQDGIRQRFPERDGMIFLSAQVDNYDRKRLRIGQAPQRELFVDDERSAIDWVSEYLKTTPSTYQEIHPEFTRQIGAGWRKHEHRPELQQLLDDNFLQYEGTGPVPPQIHCYLSSNWKELRSLDKTAPSLIAKAKGRWYVPDPARQQDVEKRREKSLLKEFEVYRAHRGRKLKEVRLEVLRAGFKAAWGNGDYQTIIDVADKVTEDAWQEDEKLLTFYDMAETRLRAG